MADHVVAGIVAKLYGDAEPAIAELEEARDALEAEIEERRKDARVYDAALAASLLDAVLRWAARQGCVVTQADGDGVHEIEILNTAAWPFRRALARFFPLDQPVVLAVTDGRRAEPKGQVVTFADLPSENLLMAVLAEIIFTEA